MKGERYQMHKKLKYEEAITKGRLYFCVFTYIINFSPLATGDDRRNRKQLGTDLELFCPFLQIINPGLSLSALQRLPFIVPCRVVLNRES